MTEKVINLLGKDYLTVDEAAHYACVSPRQFRIHADKLGILPFRFMGKIVYRRADLQRAMEREAGKQWQVITQTGTRGTSSGAKTVRRAARSTDA